MKRCISVILIPCLLLQLCGCYSFNDITFDELKTYEGSNEIRIKTNNKEFLIERQSGEINPMDWEVIDSLIIIKTKEQVKWENYYKLVDKITEIKFNELESVEIDEFDILETSLLLTGLVAIVALLIAASQMPGSPAGY
jgi:hypothetical protein